MGAVPETADATDQNWEDEPWNATRLGASGYNQVGDWP